LLAVGSVGDGDLGGVGAVVNVDGAVVQSRYVCLVIGFESDLPVGAIFFKELQDVVEVALSAAVSIGFGNVVIFDAIWGRTVCPSEFYAVVVSTQFCAYIFVAVVVSCYILGIADALFNESVDEFHVRVASKPEEIKQLLEAGFEFVCEKADLMYFRKRK